MELGLEIMSHKTEQTGTTGLCLKHIVIVRCKGPLDPVEVASKVGYHPLGYDMIGLDIHPLAEGKHRMSWRSMAVIP